MTTLTNSQSYPGSTAISQSPAVSHTTFRLKDPASAITHFIGMVAAVSAAPFLLERAAQTGHIKSIVSSLLFIISMILLYGASTFYHAVITNDRATLLLKKLDHIMIYFLIAGSYTPVCMLVLGDRTGWLLLALVWGIAAAGILINALWPVYSLRRSGLILQNGSTPPFTSLWGGCVFLQSAVFITTCPLRHSSGCLQEALFIRSAV